MTWNYRIVRSEDANVSRDVVTYYAIHEVYYDDAGSITGYTLNPMELISSDLDELRADMRLMLEAFDKPMLNKWDI